MDQHKIDELRHHYDTTDVAEHFTDATLDTRTTDDILVSTSIRLTQSLVNQVGYREAGPGVEGLLDFVGGDVVPGECGFRSLRSI